MCFFDNSSNSTVSWESFSSRTVCTPRLFLRRNIDGSITLLTFLEVAKNRLHSAGSQRLTLHLLLGHLHLCPVLGVRGLSFKDSDVEDGELTTHLVTA